MAWTETTQFDESVIRLADARVSENGETDAGRVSEVLAAAIEDVGDLYMGALSMNDAELGGLFAKILSGVRFASHLPARLEGRVFDPALPTGIPTLEMALIKVVAEVDAAVGEFTPTPEAVVTSIDASTDALLRVDLVAGAALRQADFGGWPSMSHVSNPDLRDFLFLQIYRLRLARQFVLALRPL